MNAKTTQPAGTGDSKQILTVHAGETVLEEGSQSEDMFKILKGNAELYLSYGTVNEVLIGILRQGDCFGEFGLLLGKPSLYTVIAYSDLILYRVTPEKIGAFIQENHVSALQIMRSMANTMLTMQHHINQLNAELDEKNKINPPIAGKNKEMIKNYILGSYGGRIGFDRRF